MPRRPPLLVLCARGIHASTSTTTRQVISIIVIIVIAAWEPAENDPKNNCNEDRDHKKLNTSHSYLLKAGAFPPASPSA